MATSIRKAAYFSMHVPNRAGVGASMLTALFQEGVSLRGFTGFPDAGKAQVDFIPEDTGAFLRAARKLGLKVSKRKTAFVAQADDKPGAIAAIFGKLAEAGINVIATSSAAAGKGRFGAIFWVNPKNVSRASRVLGAR